MVLEVLRALGRRWYIVLAGLLLTSGMVYGANAVSPPEYTARGLVILLPPESALVDGTNPFLLLTGLEQPASIVVAYFSSTTAQEEVSEFSATAEYEVALDASTRGPVIAIDVTNTTPENTVAVLDHLVERIPVELQQIQQDVDAPPQSFVESMTLTVDQEATEDNSAAVRLMIVAAVVGLVGTAILGYGVDSFVQRRRIPRDNEQTGRRHKSRGRRRSQGAERVPSDAEVDADSPSHETAKTRDPVLPTGPRS